jgi:hypothetical protein
VGINSSDTVNSISMTDDGILFKSIDGAVDGDATTDVLERMRVYRDGNIGMGDGTTTPVAQLHLSASGSGELGLKITNDTTGHSATDGIFFDLSANEECLLGTRDSNSMGIFTSNTRRFHIAANGDIGVNESSPGAKFEIRNDSAGSVATGMRLSNRNSTAGTGSRIEFYTNNAVFNSIDGVRTGGGSGGHLAFSTMNGSGTLTEAMRITLDQKVGIGSTAPAEKFTVVGAPSNFVGEIRVGTDAAITSSKIWQRYYSDMNASTGAISGGTARGGIRNTGTGTTPQFFTGSDLRIKKNIQEVSPVLDKLAKIKVISCDYKNSDAHDTYTVIAQDLANIMPELVDQTDDGTGSEVPEGLEPWTVTAPSSWMLVKAIQELTKRVEELERDS